MCVQIDYSYGLQQLLSAWLGACSQRGVVSPEHSTIYETWENSFGVYSAPYLVDPHEVLISWRFFSELDFQAVGDTRESQSTVFEVASGQD